MTDWIGENLSTLLVGAVTLMIIVSAVVKLIRDRKKGGASCHSGCTGCPMDGSCEKQK